jgi:hypothetical protein
MSSREHTASTDQSTTADVLDRLADARAAYRDADEAIAEVGEETLRTVQDAVERSERLCGRYESDATGTGNFQAFVEFQGKFAELVEGLPDDIPARDAFEAAESAIDKRRLSESDFTRAREALGPARDLAGRLNARTAAREDVAAARRAVSDRIDTIDAEIDELERLRRFGDADLDAPTDVLHEPITAYDEAVREAFDDFRREASARRVLAVIAETDHYPLVDFRPVPGDLLAYVREREVGTETIPTLVRYDDYSQSKLSHYVDDATAFRTGVAVHRTYLDRLSADPLTVGWPPPAAGELRALAGELVSVTAKFADESVVARARELRRLATRDDYERLRRAARADAELSDAERDRLQSGAVDAELNRLRDERERLSAALDEDATE